LEITMKKLYQNGVYILNYYGNLLNFTYFLLFYTIKRIEEHWYICMISEMIIFYFIWGIEGLCWEILSIVLTFHAVALTSSVSHIYGKRKYDCQYHANCDAKNFWITALVNGGEGWHNNHHAYMNSANHGFEWYEIDLVYIGLKILEFLGIVWELKSPPLEKLKKL